MSRHNRHKLLPAAALIALACVSCGGQDKPGSPAHGEVLQHVLTPVPEIVNPALQVQLERALDASLLEAGRTRETRGAAVGPGSGSPDFVALETNPTTLVAFWSYRNQGDYDLNGEVNVSDLTPLGQNFLKSEQDTDWITAQWADGDFNGVNNLADVSSIGQNFGARVDGYQLESKDGPSQDWVPVQSQPVILGGIVRQDMSFPKPAGIVSYRVRPYFDNGLTLEYGTPSNEFAYGATFRLNWPMLGGSPQHTGRASNAGPSSLNVYRELELEGQIFASNPVVGLDHAVYICTTFPGQGYGYVYGVGTDYTVRFRRRTRAEIITTPAVDALGRIVAIDVAGNVYCMAPDGRLFYEVALQGGQAVSPVIDSVDVLVATNEDNHLTRLDAAGQLLWSSQLGGITLSSPSILANGEIMIPFIDGVSAYFDNLGNNAGASVLGAQFLTTPCVSGNDAYCGAFAQQGLFLIQKPGNGSLFYNIGQPASSMPTLDTNGDVYIGSVDLSTTPASGKLTKLDSLGAFQWSVGVPVPVDNQPILDLSGRIYIGGAGDASGTGLYCIGSSNTILWHYQTWPDRPGTPAIYTLATLVVGLSPVDGIEHRSKLVWIRPDEII